jgi:hypothetical protein
LRRHKRSDFWKVCQGHRKAPGCRPI